MADRRQVLRALLLSAAGLGVPAACGVPSGGGPIVDGSGPSLGAAGVGNARALGPGDATDAIDLVQKFLRAISGRLDDDAARTKAVYQAQQFLTDQAKKSWHPDSQQTTLVRTSAYSPNVGDHPGSTVVSLTLQPVGLLSDRGDVQDLPQGVSEAAVAVQFTVVTNEDPGSNVRLLIDQIPPHLPPTLLLDTSALESTPGNKAYYTPQMIYFWDPAKYELVPDLRYLPQAGLSQSGQYTQLVKWLVAGPSDWLKPAVTTALPSGTTLLGPNVVPDKDGKLLVNLSASLQGADLNTLNAVMRQLRWSLSGLAPGGAVQLQIASQPQHVDGSSDAYLAMNLASRVYRSTDAEQFCVVAGVVRPVNNPGNLPPVLNSPDFNKGVASAALTRDKSLVALVRGNQLWLGQAGKAGGPATYAPVALGGRVWSRPAFLPERPPDASRVLVAVDNQLYLVNLDRSATVVTPSWANGVSAFAIAPDGHRIALIDASSGAWVAPLEDDGNALTVASPRRINPGLTGSKGIAWTRLDRVIVSGRGPDGWGLTEVTIDGVLQSSWTTKFNKEIEMVVAYPTVPSPASGTAMVQTSNGQAAVVYPKDYSPLQLTGTPLPAPSGGAAATANEPRAPFYLD
jgi:hypothetical protein